MSNYQVSHLAQLEAEAIFVIREAVAQFLNPVLLFSGGKDSIVMAHLAAKAFRPARIPFPFLHVDTGHNFPETLEFRDRYISRLNARLIVAKVQDTIDAGRVIEEKGPMASRNALQSVTLLDALRDNRFDAAFGGGRRDEEKARAKERFFSHRDEFGQWDPKNQRPELWNLFNGRKAADAHFRVFPLSNWTELDVWQYIRTEGLELPGLYFAHSRPTILRQGMILGVTDFLQPLPDEVIEDRKIRFRTVGDATCTAAVLSDAADVDAILAEVAAARLTERGGRVDDKRSDSAMEDRKKEGYF